MKVKQEVFGKVDGERVSRYILTNDHKTRVAVISLGATLQEFVVNENGTMRPLTIGLKTLADYQNNGFNISQTIGRVAGRIGGAQFELDGQTYHVDMNEETHSLHGGYHGFTKINFVGQLEKTDDTASVVLTHHVKASDDHYPGNIAVSVKFTLDNQDQLSIDFSAQTDAPTLFNPTNHVYWNVSDGQEGVDQQWLQIHSDQQLEFDAEKVPTGKRLPVAKTAYDFNQPRNLQRALDELAVENGKVEFDDAYEVTPSLNVPVASLGDVSGKRRIDIYSDRNGLVIFTADPVDGAKQDAHQYNSVATEAQTLPDAVNHPGFGDITLRPNYPATYHIMFAYQYLGD